MNEILISNKVMEARVFKFDFFFLLLMLLTLSFDYRSELGGGKTTVIVVGLAALFFGFLSMLTLKTWNKRSIYLVVFSFLYLFTASIVGVLRGQGWFDVGASLMPYLFFIMAILTVASLSVSEKNLDRVIATLIVITLFTVIYKLLFALYYYGLNLSNVRYQIISPFVILLFAYSLSSLLYRPKKHAYISLFLAILIVFIAVTRTYIVVYFSVALFWLVCLPFSYWGKYLKILLFGFLVFTVVYVVYESGVDRWIVRLFSGVSAHGIDVTAVTRIAEIDYQIRMIFESMTNLFWGMGIAAETRFSQEYYEQLRVVFSQDFEYIGKGLGHNNYVGLFFTGGVFGLLFVFTLIYYSMRAIFVFRKMRKQFLGQPKNSLFIMAWGGSSLIGYAIYGLLGGTFGDRSAALSYGLSFGLFFLGDKIVRKNEI